MTATRNIATHVAGLAAGSVAVLAGLLALEVHPIAGTLIALAGNSLVLSSLSALCQAAGPEETKLDARQKENVYGG